MKSIDIIKHVVKHKLRMVNNEEVEFELDNYGGIIISYDGSERSFYCDGNEWFASDVDEFEEGGCLFTTTDLMIYDAFAELNECQDCFGEGFYEGDLTYCCTKSAENCCASCSETIVCDCSNRRFEL